MTNNVDLVQTQELARAGVLSAPVSFKTATIARLRDVCNGCGAANAKIDFVPDSIYGLNVAPCCHVHDWRYEEGVDEEDRELADREFKNNLIRLIDAACKKSFFRRRIKWLMYARAQTYYVTVKNFGGPAFWNGKPTA